MSKRSDELLVKDMIMAAEKINSYTTNMSFETFYNDAKTIDAVIRNFEVIGEAANRLSESFKERNDSIDWFKIRGFRNKLVHDYIEIDYEIVWEIKSKFLPALLQDLKEILHETNAQ